MFQPKTVIIALAMLLAMASIMSSNSLTQANSVPSIGAVGDSPRVGSVDPGANQINVVKFQGDNVTVFDGRDHGATDGPVATSINTGPGSSPISGQVSAEQIPYTAAEASPPPSIPAGAEWHYFKGTSEPPNNWNDVGFDDSSWGVGPAGFGYGDNDDATVLDDMEGNYASVYLRKAFGVDDPSAITSLVLSLDYDDGFVAYLNGVEVARSNVSGTPPAYDALATASHEASGGNTTVHPAEKIDITSSISLLVAGDNVLALQGHNIRLSSSDLSLIPSLLVNTNVSTNSVESTESALVGRWRFDEGSGKTAKDSSGNGNNGSLKNGPAWSDGKFGKALEFNASKRQSVSVGHSSKLNFGKGSFTIAFWIKYSKQMDADVMRKGSTDTANRWFKMELPQSTNKITFNVHTGTSHTVTAPRANNDGRWHHVAAIRDVNKGRIRLYIDGKQVASAKNPSGSVSNSANLSFGSKDTRKGDFFKGGLDDIRMYGRALSSTEVKGMYSGG